MVGDARDLLSGLDAGALAAAAAPDDADPDTAARLTELFDRVEALLGPQPAAEAAAGGPRPVRPPDPG